MTSSRAPIERLGWFAFVLACALASASLALWTASQASDFQVQDDAYMFLRYADHLRAGQGVAWNAGEPPTYGATSLLYLALVVPVRACLDGEPGLAIVAASLLFGAIAFALVVRLAWVESGATRAERPWVLAFVLAPIGASADRWAAHLTNGMDTGLAMAMVALLVIAWTRLERAPTGANAWLAGAIGGASFATRPDLALFALGVPALVFVLARGELRARAALAFAVALGWIALQSLGAWLYFDTPVPLSFHVKSAGGIYGDAFRERYARVPLEQVRMFAQGYWPWLVAIGLAALARFRGLFAPQRALRNALLAVVVAHAGYYTLAVLQIVGFHQRFYYPLVPALAWLGALAAIELVRALRELAGASLPMRARVAAVAVGLLLAASVVPSLRRGWRELAIERAAGRAFHFDVFERFRERSSRFWIGLDRLAALEPPLVIATTEVGHPAVMCPRHAIVDLAGLNEASIARDGFDAARLLGAGAPDWIYLPHPDYGPMNAALRSDATFQRDYEVHEADQLSAYMGVALRRTSSRFEELARVLAQVR